MKPSTEQRYRSALAKQAILEAAAKLRSEGIAEEDVAQGAWAAALELIGERLGYQHVAGFIRLTAKHLDGSVDRNIGRC